MDRMKTIFQEALTRYQAGADKYGDFDPWTDRRDLLAEVEEELLDAINYLAMFLIQTRTLRNGTSKS